LGCGDKGGDKKMGVRGINNTKERKQKILIN
jgi:hypothetical protein